MSKDHALGAGLGDWLKEKGSTDPSWDARIFTVKNVSIRNHFTRKMKYVMSMSEWERV